jgi:hypothetical protein
MASSADGTKLVAVSVDGQIYTSTNSGIAWKSNRVADIYWSSVASSADGAKLAAAWMLNSGGGIYTSTDSGITWTSNNLPSIAWYSVASSADGTRLAAVSGGSIASGPIYLSTNSGSTWAPASLPAQNWECIVSSANGNRLAAGTYGGSIHISSDSGATWSLNGAPGAYWPSIASSADGARLAAVADIGGIYTWQIPWLNLSFSNNIISMMGHPSTKRTNRLAILAWPTNATVFTLQMNSNLTAANWLAVTNVPVITNGQNQIVLPVTNGSRFYRLKNP